MAKLVHLKFDETAGATSFANSGTLGGTWTSVNSPAPVSAVPPAGVSGNALDMGGGGSRWSQHVSGGATPQPAQVSVFFWLYLESFGPDYTPLVQKAYYSGFWGSPYGAVYIGTNPGGTITFHVATGGAPHAVTPVSYTAYTNQWKRIGLTYDGAGTLRGYIDGVKVAELTGLSPTAIDYGAGDGKWSVGGPFGGNGYTLDGFIDDFQIWDEVRDAASDYSGTQPPGHILDANTLALWRMDDTGSIITDETGKYPLTATGATSVAGKIGNGRAFTAIGHRLTNPADNAARTAAYGEWTAEAWVHPLSNAVRHIITLSGPTSASGADNALLVLRITASGFLEVFWERGAGVGVTATANAAQVPPNRWTHIATVKKFNGTNYDALFYVNGEWKQTTPNLQNSDQGSAAIWALGQYGADTTVFPNCYIDDVRVSKVARTDAEIRESFSRGAGVNGSKAAIPLTQTSALAKYPVVQTTQSGAAHAQPALPTGVPTGHRLDGDTVALWRLDEASGDAIDATGAYQMTAVNNPGSVTGRVGAARSLNGGGQHFYRAVGTALGAIFNGTWTYEGWIYLNASWADYGHLIRVQGNAFWSNPADTPIALLRVRNDKKLEWVQFSSMITSSGSWVSGQPLPTGTWLHVAMTKRAEGKNLFTFCVYINGVKISETLGVPGLSVVADGSAHTMSLGANYFPGVVDGYFNGRFDDVRISRVSRTGAEILDSYMRGLGARASSLPPVPQVVHLGHRNLLPRVDAASGVAPIPQVQQVATVSATLPEEQPDNAAPGPGGWVNGGSGTNFNSGFNG